jgi:hypothetical protein
MVGGKPEPRLKISSQPGIRPSPVINSLTSSRSASANGRISSDGSIASSARGVPSVHGPFQRGVKDVQLVCGRVVDLELALAQDPDDH